MSSEEILTPRQETILRAVVEQYVAQATPIGSAGLLAHTGLRISPATVRNEMVALEEQGYLSHPHTSAGRIPTEKGYRLYVERFVLGAKAPRRQMAALEQTVKTAPDATEALKDLAKKVAELTGGAALVSITPHNIYCTGLGYLLSQPEFHEASLAIDLGRLLDNLEETVAEVYDTIPAQALVLIGSANPFNSHCGTILVRVNTKELGTQVFGIIGPMRMDYAASKALMDGVREVIENISHKS